MAANTPQDARLYFEQDMTEADLYPVAGGMAVVYSARCPGRETANEDAAALIPFGPESGVLVVADGLGGPPAGELAASLAAGALETSVAKAARKGLMLRTAILDGFENANHVVQELGTGAATTLAVVEVRRAGIRPYHAGDSTILVVGRQGKIKLQTTSHSPVGFAVESGYLDEQEAMYHQDRHLVSNVIGSPKMRIEVGPTLELAPHDTVLLASDGLFDNLHVEEVVGRIRKGPLADVARQIADEAGQRMRHPKDGRPSKPDDLTFVVFRLDKTE